jgi:hypothetical protein
MLYKQEAMVEGLAYILKGRNHLLVVELPMSLDVQCLVVDMQGVNVEWHPGHGRELELGQSSMEVYLQMLDKLEACITDQEALRSQVQESWHAF